MAIQGACRSYGLSFRQQGAVTPQFDAVLECEMRGGQIVLRAFTSESQTSGEGLKGGTTAPGVFEYTVVGTGDLGALQMGGNHYEVLLKKPDEPKKPEASLPSPAPSAVPKPSPLPSMAPSEAAAKAEAVAVPSKRSRPPIFLFVGPTFLSYSQTRVASLSQTSLGGRLSFSAPGSFIRLSPALEVGGTVQYLALPVVTNVSGVSLGYFSTHLHGGYSFSWPGPAWRLGFFAGPYYMTTWSKGGDFGFRGLIGAHFDSKLTRVFSSARSGSFLLRFCPVGSLSDNEIAGRLSLSQIVGSSHLMNFGIDVARLGIIYPDGRAFSSLAITAVVGYGF